jgi:hypothetical protein
MNRIEIVGLFSAMKALHEEKKYDKLGEVIDVILLEAKHKSARKAEKNQSED